MTFQIEMLVLTRGDVVQLVARMILVFALRRATWRIFMHSSAIGTRTRASTG